MSKIIPTIKKTCNNAIGILLSAALSNSPPSEKLRRHFILFANIIANDIDHNMDKL